MVGWVVPSPVEVVEAAGIVGTANEDSAALVALVPVAAFAPTDSTAAAPVAPVAPAVLAPEKAVAQIVKDAEEVVGLVGAVIDLPIVLPAAAVALVIVEWQADPNPAAARRTAEDQRWGIAPTVACSMALAALVADPRTEQRYWMTSAEGSAHRPYEIHVLCDHCAHVARCRERPGQQPTIE